MIVPSGAYMALPFHIPVTEKPSAALPDRVEDYRKAEWKLKRQTVTVLPSMASLKAPRAIAAKTSGPKPMVGFGDPLFGNDVDDTT